MKAEAQVTVVNPSGLHARPAAIFVQTASNFSSNVEVMNLSTGSNWMTAKGILNVMMLGIEQHHDLALRAEGEDAQQAVDALVNLVQYELIKYDEPPAEAQSEPAAASGPANPPVSAGQAAARPVDMRALKGIPGSPGIAVGPVYIYETSEPVFERARAADPTREWQRLEEARASAARQVDELYARAEAELSADQADIFKAYNLYLNDPTLLDEVKKTIHDEGWDAPSAWAAGIENAARRLEDLPVEYLRQRAVDVRDAGKWVLRALLGFPPPAGAILPEPSVIVARDLTPADTVRLDRRSVLAFATAQGASTSHTVILAKALGLPAVVGLGEELLQAQNGVTVIVNGASGEVVLAPDEATLSKYQQRKQQVDQQAQTELAAAGEKAVTREGRAVEVVANVGSPEDAREALRYGAEGIGLLRTEFIFLDRSSAPDEEEQTRIYRSFFDVMEQRPVVVRTIDVGGDKEIPYLDLGKEANPFLGWRAIRMCLDRPEFFKTQLRALLRAGHGHDLRIMFPMIATLDEIRKARKLLDEARTEAALAGHNVAERPQVGIMVEVPSSAILADVLAKEVDFFSIGTNDLTQYTLAAERTNARVAHLGDPCHPAVLRQIDFVIRSAHQQGIWVGVCGEMAGDLDAVPILLGMNLDEFSMSAASIPAAKALLRRLDSGRLAPLVQTVLQLSSAGEVRAAVADFLKQQPDQ